MTPIEFLRTIYLGDRVIQGLVIDAWNRVAKVQIDCISRVRSADGLWHFYNDENINHGYLVFEGVHSIAIQPAGSLPSDYVKDYEVSEVKTDSFDGYLFWISSADPEGPNKGEVRITILAKDLYLEDPKAPGQPIRT